MSDGISFEDVKFEPYWWEAAPRPSPPQAALPERADVAIVGSGYSGLAAAHTLARADRHVVVLEAGAPGEGASSRNGGMCGDLLKLGPDALTRRYGRERAFALVREAQTALDYLGDFIESEQIQCHFQRTGRFMGAHKASRYETLARETERLRKDFGFDAHMVPREDQRGEVGTGRYFGGRVMAHHGGLHPGLYHQELLERAVAAGAEVVAHTPVIDIAREGDRFTVSTPSGRVRARDVVVATNGYTSAATPGFRRRLIPIASAIIATEPLARDLMSRLMPKGRMITDSRMNLCYYRPSPDGERILFGGRASVRQLDPRESGARLHRIMTDLFPELAGTRITHSWSGYIAYSFDRLPHTGVRDGVHYAMAYCGSGVVMATYLGHKTGLKLLGVRDGATAFDGLDFPTRPFYTGNPWFLPLASLGYRLYDRFGR